MRILIASGEVSGDRIGARVARELRRRDPLCGLFGLGGPHMEAAGVEIVGSTAHLGTVGVTEAAAVAPRLYRHWRRVRQRILTAPPDAALLIGNDLFHVLVARRLRALGVPTIACFPPQVWIWRSLAGPIARSFDAILASFAEEHDVYRAAGGRVTFVGHYLADFLTPVTSAERSAARAAVGLPADGPVVGLLPGSRVHEVRRVGPALMDAAAELARRHPGLRFSLAVAHDRLQPVIERQLRPRDLGDAVRLTTSSLDAMRAADLLLVASGTATLEATLLGVPMVIAYRISRSSHLLVRAGLALGLLPAYVVGLPNIILGRRAVPELLQGNMTGAALADEAAAMLANPERVLAQRAALAEAAPRLTGGGTVARIADAVLGFAAGPRTGQVAADSEARRPSVRPDPLGGLE